MAVACPPSLYRGASWLLSEKCLSRSAHRRRISSPPCTTFRAILASSCRAAARKDNRLNGDKLLFRQSGFFFRVASRSQRLSRAIPWNETPQRSLLVAKVDRFPSTRSRSVLLDYQRIIRMMKLISPDGETFDRVSLIAISRSPNLRNVYFYPISPSIYLSLSARVRGRKTSVHLTIPAAIEIKFSRSSRQPWSLPLVTPARSAPAWKNLYSREKEKEREREREREMRNTRRESTLASIFVWLREAPSSARPDRVELRRLDGSVPVWCTVVHERTDGWTDRQPVVVEHCCAGGAAWSASHRLFFHPSFSRARSPWSSRMHACWRLSPAWPLILHLFPVCLPQPQREKARKRVSTSRFVGILAPRLRLALLLRGALGEKLAGGHHGGYTAGFSRVSRTARNTQSVPPRGSRNSLGNRFTSSSSSRAAAPLLPLRFPYRFLLLFAAWPSLSPCPPPRPCHLRPPYAPSGSYLRVLLIFSYYRWWACGATLNALTHLPSRRVIRICTRYRRVRSRARGPSVFPPIPLLLLLLLLLLRAASSSSFFPLFLRCFSPLPFSPLLFSRLFSQVLQYVSTLLQTQRRQRERETDRASVWQFSRGLHGDSVGLGGWSRGGETHTRFWLHGENAWEVHARVFRCSHRYSPLSVSHSFLSSRLFLSPVSCLACFSLSLSHPFPFFSSSPRPAFSSDTRFHLCCLWYLAPVLVRLVFVVSPPPFCPRDRLEFVHPGRAPVTNAIGWNRFLLLSKVFFKPSFPETYDLLARVSIFA